MTEEIKQETEQETSTASKQDNTGEKLFTQAELDAKIKARLDRAEATTKKQIDTLTAELAEVHKDVEFYEEQLGVVLDVQTADWDGAFKELFKALPVKEQLAKLKDADFMGKVNRKNVMPVTPKPDDSVSTGKQVAFGGKG